ncbi:MAG: YidC/Oxa1 family membrane protein insertase [Anaeroplasmataceae bacterium]
MKSYFKRNVNKISFLAILLVALVVLTSCRQGKWPNTVYTTWGAEFKFSSFGQGFTGWPVAILSYPIAWLMHLIGKALGNSYAWGLIFTTIIVRTIAWPIYAKQNSSSIKMQLIQPEMEKVQRKYAGRKDPESQRRMQAETLAIYKKYKMNPFGCVFTMLLQFPIFMGMYEAVRRVNLYSTTVIDGGASTLVQPGRFALTNTKLFGYFELNSSFSSGVLHDKIFVVVVGLLFSACTLLSQYLGQKQPSYVKKRPNAQQDQMAKQMKFMNYFMVVMFFVMSLSSTSLAVYWLIGGIYQLLQSHIGRKMNERNYYKMKSKMD